MNAKCIFKSFLLGCVLFALFSPATAITYPQLALGGGYEVTVIVSNISNEVWIGDAFLRTGAGVAWATPWTLNGFAISTNGFVYVLPAGASRKVVLKGDSKARAGYLEISGREGFPEDAVITSFFYNFLSQGQGAQSKHVAAQSPLNNGQLLDSTGVPAGRAATKLAFPVEKTSSVNTGFAWAPFSVLTGFEITLTLFDEQGNQVQPQPQLATFPKECLREVRFLPERLKGSLIWG